MMVYDKKCAVKQMDNPVRWFIYGLISNIRNLIDILSRYLENFEPTHRRVNHCHEGKTNIIINGSADRLMLAYTLTI